MDVQVLSDVKLNIGQSEKELEKIAEKRLKCKPAYFRIRKKSLDARDKSNLKYVYTIEFSKTPIAKIEKTYDLLPKSKQPQRRVLVVGSGPAGLFCALRLLDHGIQPIVIERGDKVEERIKKIELFSTQRALDVNSNVQFGEGGAGTFSDGKLNTQTHSVYNRDVLETFVKYGAPEEILWLNKPHIGSDKLRTVVKNMREDINNRGGEIRFRTMLEDIRLAGNQVSTVICKDTLTGELSELEVHSVVLAIGHSARDTFEMLLRKGVVIRQKDFAVGVRIEHLQSMVGLAQYGKDYMKLPAADYKLVSHAGDRAAFTFCMCPGGYVMPAASEEGGVVVNGMSNYARDGMNANSALIVPVTGKDFGSDTPLAGVEFQRKLEHAAYIAGGKTYAAPTQLVGDFLKDRVSDKFKEVQPTYAAGTAFADLREVLPPFIIEALKCGLTDLDRKLHDFAVDCAILTGVESRTSSPVRIERGEDMQSVSIVGLYPCGEGAGYAGGITSSAADGLRVAEAIYQQLSE